MLPYASWCYFSTLLVVYMYFFNSVSASNTSCPTWFYYNCSTHQCECGELISGKVNCNQQEMKVEIVEGFCATSTEQEGLYYAGYCPLSHTDNNTNRMYSELPSDPDLLNEMMCGPYNRKGLLCGECIDGYGPAVYSTDMKCANCSKLSTAYAVSLYLFLEFIPVTVFFICVVIFRLRITAGPLLWYVIACQAYVSISQQQLYTSDYILSHVSAPLQILAKCSMVLSGFWTLQYFKFVIPPFCISEKLTSIHIPILSLVTSIYPIVLVIITCILMELHARNYRIIHMIWKPFSIILKKINITTVTRDAVIHAFATFILLSASTLTYNASSIFAVIDVYQSIDGTVYRTAVYTDPMIAAFSHKHTPYIVIAVVPFIVLVLIPSVLLIVYPTRIYRCLSRFLSARKRLAITAFVEALHNSFKDGLNGTRDYRALAGFMILCGIVAPISDYIVGKHYVSPFTLAIGAIFLSFVLTYARPCKLTIANLSLSYHTMVIGIFSIADGVWEHDWSTKTSTLEKTFIILPVISHILVFIWAGYVLAHWIMAHFRYRFNSSKYKVALNDFANAVKQHFHRRRDSYEVLPDTDTDILA